MNTYKAILDTRRPNGVIANITQFDNATLELQIVTNGEIGDAWNQPQFELVAMKRDQQAVRESNQDAFTRVDTGEHLVTVELKEQFLTCRGSVKMQLVVKDGDRLSTSVFYVMIGESLDHGIVESHRDVAVLDELEEYVKSGYDDLAHQEQRMKDVEKATHELNELMVGNEAERQEAESKRQALFEGNEEQRQDTFNQQLTSQRREFDDSQADREGAFNDLKQNMSSEFNAAQNEREREFDTMMSSNQAQFDGAMSSNQAQFNRAESARATTFSNRQIENERVFTANENARQTLFNTNEAGRKTNETTRIANENTRKTNETGRVAAETQRQQKMSEFEAKATQLSDELDAQVARVDAFVSANEEKLLGDRDKVDYMGNTHESVKAASDANVDWLLGEVNTAHYEGQHITANDTIEGRAKSAILSGQTFVNLPTFTQSGNLQFNYAQVLTKEGLSLLKPSTKYFLKIFNHTTEDKKYTTHPTLFVLQSTPVLANSSSTYVVSTNSDLSKGSCLLRNETDHELGNSLDVLLIEYQDGMENWDIPYFTGMQSVKLPVLKAIGKNLFDVNGGFDHSNSLRVEGNNVIVNTNKAYQSSYIDITNLLITDRIYSVSVDMYGQGRFSIRENEYNGNAVVIFTNQTGNKTGSFNVKANTKYFLRVDNGDAVDTDVVFSNIQLEEGSAATTYEPYKSNILTVNEPVELRGIGDVQDELNLLTGELTQRIGDVVLDGSENWSIFQRAGSMDFTKTSAFYTVVTSIDINFNNDNTNVVCSNGIKGQGIYYSDAEGCLTKTNSLRIAINKDKLETDDVNGFKKYLSNNPITVYTQIATESIKTVDLSDNAVYSYDEVTHYDCSSGAGSLLPTLSVDVPTNLSALVSRQRATIETLETENRALKEGQVELELGHERQEEEIISTQDAVNFLLFDVLDVVPYELGQKEYDRMAVYIANQIIRGKVTYQLAVSKYPQFLTDIDEILVNESRGDLIVKID